MSSLKRCCIYNCYKSVKPLHELCIQHSIQCKTCNCFCANETINGNSYCGGCATVQRRFPAFIEAQQEPEEEKKSMATLRPKQPEQENKKKRKQSKLYTIEKIVKKKLVGEGNKWQVYYNVKWLGYPWAQNTWEPKESLEKTARETVEDYEQQNKKKVKV